MEYADFETYRGVWGGKADEADFKRVLPLACRLIDAEVTGVDGFAKLKLAPPAEQSDIDAVAVCVCAVADLLMRVSAREDAADAICGGIASVSSGNERISFRAGGASSDPSERRRIISQTVSEMLSGVKDGNCVNLLYMGRYPSDLLPEKR